MLTFQKEPQGERCGDACNLLFSGIFWTDVSLATCFPHLRLRPQDNIQQSQPFAHCLFAFLLAISHTVDGGADVRECTASGLDKWVTMTWRIICDNERSVHNPRHIWNFNEEHLVSIARPLQCAVIICSTDQHGEVAKVNPILPEKFTSCVVLTKSSCNKWSFWNLHACSFAASLLQVDTVLLVVNRCILN